MIHHTPPSISLQNFVCLDVGQKKTGLANNFNSNNISFAWKVLKTEYILQDLSQYSNCSTIIVGLPTAYPESESYIFIVGFIDFLQQNLLEFDFIFWDETDSSNIIRNLYKHGRAKFRKSFYKKYDAQSASIVLADFLLCNF